MEELDPLLPTGAEIAMSVVQLAIAVAVFVASYRRSRCLSGYPVWRSVLIALVAAAFWPIWLIVWVVNEPRIRREWRAYRLEKAARESHRGAGRDAVGRH